MDSWKKYALVAVTAAVAGFAYIKGSHRNVPSDFRDAPNDGTFSEDFNLQSIKASAIAAPGEASAPVPVAGNAGGQSDGPFATVNESDLEEVFQIRSYDIGYLTAVKRGDFIRDGFTYQLRYCLAISGKAMTLKRDPNCDKILVDKAERVMDTILQAAFTMQKLDDVSGTDSHSNKKGDVYLPWISGEDAYRSAVIKGSPLQGDIMFGYLKESALEYDPDNNTKLKSLSANVVNEYPYFSVQATDGAYLEKIRYEFERKRELLGDKSKVFRITKTLTPDKITRVSPGECITEQVTQNSDNSLSYKYGLKLLKGGNYEIDVKIKDGGIVYANSKGLVGIARVEAMKQKAKRLEQLRERVREDVHKERRELGLDVRAAGNNEARDKAEREIAMDPAFAIWKQKIRDGR